MTTSPFLGISKSGNWCFSIGTENVTPSGLNSSVKRERLREKKKEGREEGRGQGGRQKKEEREGGDSVHTSVTIRISVQA